MNPQPITLNGQAQPCAPGTTLAELIARQGVPPDAVATAINGTFVARGQRVQHTLQPGDSVTTFQPIVGG
jgi:sulfur carrier protein